MKKEMLDFLEDPKIDENDFWGQVKELEEMHRVLKMKFDDFQRKYPLQDFNNSAYGFDYTGALTIFPLYPGDVSSSDE